MSKFLIFFTPPQLVSLSERNMGLHRMKKIHHQLHLLIIKILGDPHIPNFTSPPLWFTHKDSSEASISVAFSYETEKATLRGWSWVTTPTIVPKSNSISHTNLKPNMLPKALPTHPNAPPKPTTMSIQCQFVTAYLLCFFKMGSLKKLYLEKSKV